MSKDEGFEETEIKHQKQSILKSSLFSAIEKDLLTVLLENEKEYSIDECLKILKKENKRMVK